MNSEALWRELYLRDIKNSISILPATVNCWKDFYKSNCKKNKLFDFFINSNLSIFFF